MNLSISSFNPLKQFVLKALIAAVPIFLVLVLVNYFGDAARIFSSDYEKRISKIITEGHYVTNIKNYDERLVQKELIGSNAIHPDLVIIGSSRTMLLDSSFFPNVSLFNNSVSGASIEDIIGIYQMYKENNKVPKSIIIGIDPWLFNKNSGRNKWKSIARYFYDFLEGETNSYYNINYKLRQLISFSYFQGSVKRLPALFRAKSEPVPTTKLYNISNTKLTDGSLIYSKDYRGASAEEIENRVKTYFVGNVYGVEGFDEISVTIWEQFNKLITDMRKNNIEIKLFLLPYHPEAFIRIKKDYKLVIKTESMISKFAKENNIELYGSFSPFKLGMDATYFYDAMHCKKSGIRKVLELNH